MKTLSSPLDRRQLLALGATGLCTPGLRAQGWPAKAIRFVVPFAPGGSSEIVARAAAARGIKEPAALERLGTDAALAVGSNAAEFAQFIAGEQKRWQPVIARARIKPE